VVKPRLACVDVPALPLQLLLRQRPEWRDQPAVVVEDDKPTARILWHNRLAAASKIRRGMRLNEAQSLASAVQAGVLDATAVTAAGEALWKLLLTWTPSVEPSESRPGSFWLDANGLLPLFGSLEAWSHGLHGVLTEQGWVSAVVVGFNRYHVYALARTRMGPWVLPAPEVEAHAARRVPLTRLDVSPPLLEALSTLGVQSLGELLRLPVSELRGRLGREAETIHRLANETLWAPLRPRHATPPRRVVLQIEPADSDHNRLLFAIKGMLPGLLAPLREASEALLALQLVLELERSEAVCERLEPAAPTLDEVLLLELIRLRLASLTLAAPVEQITLTAEALPARPDQLTMLSQRPRRDLAAASLALAKVRALLGEAAVTRAALRAEHLPEARFAWEKLQAMEAPEAVGAELLPPLVRQVLPEPLLLPPKPRHEPERWLGTEGAVRAMVGPFRMSQGWWAHGVERDYYYVGTQRGNLLWLYFDQARRRWFLHGIVD
jgi:protein ImuB